MLTIVVQQQKRLCRFWKYILLLWCIWKADDQKDGGFGKDLRHLVWNFFFLQIWALHHSNVHKLTWNNMTDAGLTRVEVTGKLSSVLPLKAGGWFVPHVGGNCWQIDEKIFFFNYSFFFFLSIMDLQMFDLLIWVIVPCFASPKIVFLFVFCRKMSIKSFYKHTFPF